MLRLGELLSEEDCEVVVEPFGTLSSVDRTVEFTSMDARRTTSIASLSRTVSVHSLVNEQALSRGFPGVNNYLHKVQLGENQLSTPRDTAPTSARSELLKSSSKRSLTKSTSRLVLEPLRADTFRENDAIRTSMFPSGGGLPSDLKLSARANDAN